jgi:hypothetical protein
MATLTGSTQPISLGEGYALRAPGIRGSADLQRPRTQSERARSRSPRDGTAELDEALRATNVVEIREIEVTASPTGPAPAAARGRGEERAETIELQVPDLGPENGQVVLAADESGAMTWHLPIGAAPQAGTAATRGTGGVKRFVVPAPRPPAPAPGVTAKRGLIGIAGRTLLKVLVYPLIDPVIGAVSEIFAERWAQRSRPYGLRTFTPDNFRTAGGAALSESDWTRLRAGQALLFIHGTFSTAHGAFALIEPAAFKTLFDRYDGRVFAFNHFTLSHDPRRNVEWLAGQLPGGDSLELDIVCHSRGGLVARTIAEQPSVFGLDTSRFKVRRIVFVGVPNSGTLLAHPDHMMKMIDRFTTALNVFPSGAVTETLEAIITAVKVLAHGALKGLQGLASMQPDGEFLKKLNQGAPAGSGYYAIAADYEPTSPGLRALVAGSVADGVLDRVFEGIGNDLVVPEPGVYGANGSAAFPIPDERLLRVKNDAGVIHTTLFGHAPAWRKVAEWLA